MVRKETEMKETKRRTLYECSNACVKGDSIHCSKGYVLSINSGNGHIDVRRLAKGEALMFKVCQKCTDFDRIGPPVLPEERGWLRKDGSFRQ